MLLCAPLMLGVTACNNGGGNDDEVPPASAVFATPQAAGSDVGTDIGWTAPDSSQLTGYSISASSTGQATVNKIVDATLQSTTLSGLVADKDYTVSVTAQYPQGASSATAATVHTPRITNTLAETAAFQNAADYSASHNGDAVMVMRDGQIVFERYVGSYNRDDLHVLASGTKSFSCAFMLAAEGDHYLSRNDTVSDVITEWKSDPNKSKASVLQVLSLQSGLSTNPDYSPADVADLDTYQLAIDDPANYAPGQAFIYDPIAFQAFALMFERKTANMDPIAYLQTKIFSKLGISDSDYFWQRDAEDHPQMAGGSSFSAPVWARYGQMILQNGTWQGTRVLPAQGVKDCVTYPNPAYLGYGITWWLNRDVGDTYDPSIDVIPADGVADSGGHQIAPHVPADMIMAAGTGHQRMYLLPTQRMVVIRLAPLTTETDEWSDDEFLSRLLANSAG
jgi:CubicO group peptidase (beta-lactamase class C family)